MTEIYVTMNNIRRYEIVKDWLGRKLDGKKAALLLGVSYRHALRLKKAFKEKSFEGLIPRKRGGRNAYPDSLRVKVARLFDNKYDGRFNIANFHEKLEQVEGIQSPDEYPNIR